MTDTPFLQLSERWRLAYDRHQWIVQKRGSFDPKRDCYRWEGVSFIAERRAGLVRSLLDKGAAVDDWRTVLMLPDTFKEWKRMRAEAAFKGGHVAESESGGAMPTPALAA